MGAQSKPKQSKHVWVDYLNCDMTTITMNRLRSELIQTYTLGWLVVNDQLSYCMSVYSDRIMLSSNLEVFRVLLV